MVIIQMISTTGIVRRLYLKIQFLKYCYPSKCQTNVMKECFKKQLKMLKPSFSNFFDLFYFFTYCSFNYFLFCC